MRGAPEWQEGELAAAGEAGASSAHSRPPAGLAQAQGQIALGLIQVYKALGGGWQIRTESAGVSMPSAVPESIATPEHETIVPQLHPDGLKHAPLDEPDVSEATDTKP